MQQSNESLETFYSCEQELGLLCKLENLDEDLVKDPSFLICVVQISKWSYSQKCLLRKNAELRHQKRQKTSKQAKDIKGKLKLKHDILCVTEQTANQLNNKYSVEINTLREMWKSIQYGFPSNMLRRKHTVKII